MEPLGETGNGILLSSSTSSTTQSRSVGALGPPLGVGFANPSLGGGLPVHADGRGQETLPSSGFRGQRTVSKALGMGFAGTRPKSVASILNVTVKGKLYG